MFKERYLHKAIRQDLKEKMVFVGGPRQVGKTTLAKIVGQFDFQDFSYLNWDSRQDRKKILAETFDASERLLILDEIHKYKRWKNYVKGLFDTHREQFSILVTGSARLDIYKRGGDSLLGRYHYYRLHPFSVAEMIGVPHQRLKPRLPLSILPYAETHQSAFKALLQFGGFPEPLFKKDETTARRWRLERVERIVKEDVRDLESIRDLSALQVLSELLSTKVGSRLSLNSLREDLEVAHKTIASWMDVLEKLYYHYRVYPFTASRIKTLRKEPKLYLWDWSEVENSAARLENLVGSHLLKFTHFLQDVYGYKVEMHYLRDTAGREVDFLITENKKPWFAVEVKEAETAPSPHLRYFAERLKIPFLYQIVAKPGVDLLHKNIRIISASHFLATLV